MKSAAFNAVIAKAFTVPLKTVTVYTRLLKEAGLLTTGAGGRNAPEMTPMDAARLTIALLATNSPSQCVERVQRFGKIKYSPKFTSIFRGTEIIQPEQFSQLFKGETLEEVLAYIFSLPGLMGIERSAEWFHENIFHLRVSDFNVLAELFAWKREGGKVVGERVVPFKGATMVQTKDGFLPVAGFTVIKGGIRTERSISGNGFLEIGYALSISDPDQEGQA